MTVPNRGRRAVALMYGLAALTVHGVQGQTPASSEQKPTAPSTAAEQTSEAHQQKLAIGFRARILPFRSFSVMDNGRVLKTTTVSKVNYDSNYNTISHSFILGGGLTLEGWISRRTLVTADVLFNRLRYDRTTDVYSGTDDPTTSADERSHQNTTENTAARLFDLPVLIQRNVRPTGFLSHVYVAAGPSARLVSTVHTTTNITYADATKGNSASPAAVSKRLLIGGTVGVGLRFVDEFNIKVTPEVRYTRWNGMTFNQDSTRSPRNQLEVGIGFSR
jgi:hypothetical protein